MKKFRDQLPDEEREVYLLKVAAEFIRMHANYETMFYDDAECDGECLAGELEKQASELEEG